MLESIKFPISLSWYIFQTVQALLHHQNYEINQCFPVFPNDNYGARFKDNLGLDNFSTLSSGVFWRLINISPSHLVYRQDMYHIEPYLPSRFACQFDYTQLYVGNPNKVLAYQGNLFEGIRRWFYFIARGTGAEFTLPQKYRFWI